MKHFKELVAFIRNVANDARIPESDKKMILLFVALIISPVDLIPDWIPLLGIVDDIVILAFVLDYFFNHLDREILLSHYPWGMKSYVRLRRVSQFIAQLTPGFIKNKLWSYKPSVYQR